MSLVKKLGDGARSVGRGIKESSKYVVEKAGRGVAYGLIGAALTFGGSSVAKGDSVNLEDYLTYSLPQPPSPEVWVQNARDLENLVNTTLVPSPEVDTVILPSIRIDQKSPTESTIWPISLHRPNTNYETTTDPIPVSPEAAHDVPTQGTIFMDDVSLAEGVTLNGIIFNIPYDPGAAVALNDQNLTIQNCYFVGNGTSGPNRAIEITSGALASGEFTRNVLNNFTIGALVEQGNDVSRWRENYWLGCDVGFKGRSDADFGRVGDEGNNVFYVEGSQLIADFTEYPLGAAAASNGVDFPFQLNWFYINGELVTASPEIVVRMPGAEIVPPGGGGGAAAASSSDKISAASPGPTVLLEPVQPDYHPLFPPVTTPVTGWQVYH